MKLIDRFLKHHVNRLIDTCLAENLDMPPVDLQEIAARSAVFEIEERRMIPEAVLSPEGTRFRIYLQSNFKDFPGARVRQRFSLAHEIAHTFFYERRDGALRPIKDTPRGDVLEFACHEGAGLLLVPDRVLHREVRRIGEPIGAKNTIELARKFDVSAEVMVRRLNAIRAFDSTDIAVVLVRRRSSGMAVIECAAYPPWLQSLLPTPERGTAFASWIQSPDQYSRPDRSGEDISVLFEKGLQRQVARGTLLASPFRVSSSQHIFELRI